MKVQTKLNHRKPAVLWAAAAFALLLLAVLAVHRHRLGNDLSAHKFKVTIANERQDAYIWIDSEASATVWIPGADAGDDPVAGVRSQLELPKNRLGNGFQAQPQEVVEGFITLPSDSELQRYIRKGYELRLAVRVVPGGYYSKRLPL